MGTSNINKYTSDYTHSPSVISFYNSDNNPLVLTFTVLKEAAMVKEGFEVSLATVKVNANGVGASACEYM